MTITRFGAAFLLIAAALPFVAAQPNSGGPSSCKGPEFWWEKKSCCLTRGGPPSYDKPPSGKQCPSKNWSWSHEHGCCIPHQPPPPSNPQCPRDWDWSPHDSCCNKSPWNPQPSGSYTNRKRSETIRRDPSSCNNHEFWFPDKGCCVTRGGPSAHPKPPAEKQCPPSGWSWSKDHECCIPHQERRPPPQCSNNWKWSSSDLCCKKSPYPSQPLPSGGGSYHGDLKRSLDASRSFTQCPAKLSACPIVTANGLTGDFECLDTTHDLESCGGCASVGEGQDCTAIQGSWNVGCESGSCAVYTCAAGFQRSTDGKSCTAL